MLRRVYSLETEYALAFNQSSQVATTENLTIDDLYSLLEAELLARHSHAVCDPTVNRSSRRQDTFIEMREGYFLANGARIYYDTGHLEWAAPETSDPRQATIYDQAAVQELDCAIQQINSKMNSGRPMIIKNNLDYITGNTYGCHENYSIRVRSIRGRNVMRQIQSKLIPFLVTRQILSGAGRLGATKAPFTAYQLSSRADFITSISSVDTRENRPIVNLRDEPLADKRKFVRLHLILGDSNMAEYPTFLKLGMTGILLDMIEQDIELPNITLLNPIAAIQQVSRDLTFRSRLPLRGGGFATALDIQRAYWQAAKAFVQQEDDSLARQILQLWDGLLTALESRSTDLDFILDWAIKRRIFTEILEQENASWDLLTAWEPILARTWHLQPPIRQPVMGWGQWFRSQLSKSKWDAIATHCHENKLSWNNYHAIRKLVMSLRLADVHYHEISEANSLFYKHGHAVKLLEPEMVATARQQAPADTRAVVRSQAIQQALQSGKNVCMDWDYVQRMDSKKGIRLPDPLSNDPSPLQRLFPLPQIISDFNKVRVSAKKPLPEFHDEDIDIVVLSVEDIVNGDDK